MSFSTAGYTRAGFSLSMAAPVSGTYYASVVLYNALTQGFNIQNGVNQLFLSAQQAQLFAVPNSGSAIAIIPLPSGTSFPYGSWLGPIQAVWFYPDETPGSYPVTLGALSGLVQWTPVVNLGSNPVYVVPGTTISSILISNASDTSETITITGYQSDAVLGEATLAGNTSVQIPLEEGTGDTVFAITSSGPITGIVSLAVGVPPVVSVTPGGGGATVYYASLTGAGETATPGDLTQQGGLTVDSSTSITLTDDAGGIFILETADATLQITSAGQLNVTAIGGAALSIQSEGGGDIVVNSDNELQVASTGDTGIDSGGNLRLISGSGATIVAAGGASTITVNADEIGFYAVEPVAPQISGATLAGVIAGLVALGLFAS